MKKESNYNKSVQDKVDQVSFDYDAADWETLSKQLPPKGMSALAKVFIGIASTAIISAGVYYGINSDDKTSFTADSPQSETVKSMPSITEEIIQEKTAEKQESTINSKVQAETKSEAVKPGQIKNDQRPNINANTNKQIAVETPKIETKKPTPVYASTITIINDKICLGEAISFSLDQSLGNNQTILLNGNTVQKGKNSIKSSVTGINELQLVEGEKIISTASINVVELPNASFLTTKANEEFAKIDYAFESESFSNSYSWLIDGIKAGNEQKINHVFKRKGNVSVELTVTNAEGCKNSETKNVAIEESFDLLSYDAFTPDGDGINDEFIPKALEANNLKFTMTVYSPSGVELYTTNDFYQPWNGRRNNSGEMMPTGVYLWKILVYDDEQEAHPFSGQIKIVQLR